MQHKFGSSAKKSGSIDTLISFVENAHLKEGTFYSHYPITDPLDEKSSLDSFLISSEHGIIVFDIVEEEKVSDRNPFRKNLHQIMENRLKSYDELTGKNKKLKAHLTVLTFAPYWKEQHQQKDTVTTQEDLSKFLGTRKKPDLTGDDYTKLLDAISNEYPQGTEASRQKKAGVKSIWAVSFGILAIMSWVTLFTIGLQVNSTYYRAAISYGYWDFFDWFASIISFTLSNVALLAFFAGFLGGTCSKIIITEGFMLTRKQLTAKKVEYVLYENPFISAFRGIFLFLAILSLQYISSFSDLGTINKDSAAKQSIQAITDKGKYYIALLDSMQDPVSQKKIISVWERENSSIKLSDAEVNDSMVKKIFLYRDSSNRSNTPSEIKERLQEKIRTLRRSITVPSLSDIPGMSSSSYFKFAIIVSLLAFICGYNPGLFSAFLSRLPFINQKDNEKNKQDEKEDITEPGDEVKEDTK